MDSEPKTLGVISDRVGDPTGKLKRIRVREPHHSPPQPLQLHLPQMIPEHDIVPTVDTAVDLDDQPQPFAGEVREIRPEWMLSPKPVPIDFSAPQLFPDTTLREPRALPL